MNRHPEQQQQQTLISQGSSKQRQIKELTTSVTKMIIKRPRYMKGGIRYHRTLKTTANKQTQRHRSNSDKMETSRRAASSQARAGDGAHLFSVAGQSVTGGAATFRPLEPLEPHLKIYAHYPACLTCCIKNSKRR